MHFKMMINYSYAVIYNRNKIFFNEFFITFLRE